MKRALMLLIAANIAFFAWQLLKGKEPQPAQSEVAPAVGQAAGARLELLSESDSVSPLATAGETPGASGEPLCWMLGPMPELVTAKQVQMRFQKQEIQADLKHIEVITGLDYLLYIGPFDSRGDGLARLRELQGEGIDSFLITRGGLANAISLGLFSSVAQAESALASFAEQGYEANIRENERTGKQLWLIVPMLDAESLDGAFWDELALDFDHLERKQNWCKSIASADGIE